MQTLNQKQRLESGPSETQRHRFSMYKNQELNLSPSLRYASYFLWIQTAGITYLSKAINTIKKKKHIQRGENLIRALKKYCT